MKSPLFTAIQAFLLFLLCGLSSLACAQESGEAPSSDDGAPVQARDGEDSEVEAAGEAGGERLVIREATLSLTAEDPEGAGRKIGKLTKQLEGFVLSSELRSIDGASRRLLMTIRVPEDRLEEALVALGRQGEVLEQSTTGKDVTEEFVDVGSRLAALRTLESRLLAMTESTGNLKDLLALEQELARVRSDIESKQGRQKYLRSRSQLATIVVTVSSPEQPLLSGSESVFSQFVNAFHQSAAWAGAVARGLIVVCGALLPFSLLLGCGYMSFRAFRRLRDRLAHGG